MNNEKNQNGRGIFYGVIGVATLIVAIIGATFAYFTASQDNNNVITGNAASIKFDLKVERAETTDITKGGLIPMSNTMVEAAASNASTKGVCVDNNGNSVCQIYKITVTNTSSASMFLDGYVTLANDTGGPLGSPTDITYKNTTAATTMRWAQVFEGTTADVGVGNYTTSGKTTTGATVATDQVDAVNGFTNSTNPWASIGLNDTAAGSISNDLKGKNLGNIYTNTTDVVGTITTAASIYTSGTISGNPYDVINRNYIRISDHAANASYTRANDLSSALVFSQYLDASTGTKPSQVFYIVVWLSETGTNQTPGEGTNGSGTDFFQGTVTFLSAQGGEVTATFSNYATVKPTDTAGAGATETT